jgi:hypothetical protein
MAHLGGQRAQFTWALNEYNKSEDPDTRVKFARRMAKYIAPPQLMVLPFLKSQRAGIIQRR